MKFTTLMMSPEGRFYYEAFAAAELAFEAAKAAGKPTQSVFDIGCQIIRNEWAKAQRQMTRIMEQQED